MKQYLNGMDAVNDLHKKGFTNDFQLIGNDLLWVQGKSFIRAGEFAILEYHTIIETKQKSDEHELIIFGIVAPMHHIKGILINHYKSYTTTTPPVIVKKINELKIHAGID
jgi:hypothetical protein